MKILLDECLPRQLGPCLFGHEVKTIEQVGWKGIKNGELLKKASNEFDLFITVDKDMPFQQNPQTLPIPVIVLHPKSTQVHDLESIAPEILTLIKKPILKKFYTLGV